MLPRHLSAMSALQAGDSYTPSFPASVVRALLCGSQNIRLAVNVKQILKPTDFFEPQQQLLQGATPLLAGGRTNQEQQSGKICSIDVS